MTNTNSADNFQSPFAHILATNHAPDKDEIQKITSFLHEPQHKLDLLNDQITQLEETLSKLKSERDTLANHIGEHRALLAPFRRLPTDIIREIFVHCLDPYPTRSTQHAPLLLTTICRNWRCIALETPRLWCAIHLFIPDIDNYTWTRESAEQRAKCLEEYRDLVKERLAGVNRWLNRSGSVPITLSLSFAPGLLDWYAFPDHQTEVAEIVGSVVGNLVRYCGRWRELCIWDLRRVDMLAPLRTLKPDEIPKLESLNVDTVSDAEIDYFKSLLQAPSLRSLHLGYMQHPPSSLPVRWNQLTEIDIDCSTADLCPASDLLRIFLHMHQNVRKCTFSMNVPNTPPDYAQQLGCSRIHLPSLEYLHLTFMKDDLEDDGTVDLDHNDISSVMKVLVCPSLENLAILDRRFVPEQIMTEFPLVEFLNQSGCSLKSFGTNFILSTLAFQQCLRCSPSIMSLFLHRVSYRQYIPTAEDLPTDEVVRCLDYSDSAGSDLLCPLLENLCLSYVPPSSADTVVRLIAARLGLQDTEKTRRLRTVQVRFDGCTGEEYRSKVNEFREQGLRIRWAFSNYARRGRYSDPPDGGLPQHWPDESSGFLAV